MADSKVFKYRLNVGVTTILMGKDAKVLAVQVQHNTPCIWALVQPGEIESERVFRVYGTGHAIEGGSYVGTFQLHDGAFVGHVFEEAKRG